MSPEKRPGFRTCCTLRRELASEFATSARLYAEAVAILTSGLNYGLDFENLRLAMRRAQERAEEARVAFEEHVARHAC